MAIKERYVFVDMPPQTGEALANVPLLQRYAEVLNKAQNNVQNGEGALYQAEPVSREVSLSYTLNSIYRELLKWRNEQPNNPDIQQLRQDVVTLFESILPQEFPHIGENYKIKNDYIEFNTKDELTDKIINPQLFYINDEQKAQLQNIVMRLDSFLNENETTRLYEGGSQQEQMHRKKFDNISFGAIRKMQYYLIEKMENKQVYSFQSTEEKVRAYRNTLAEQIKPLTDVNAENAGDFVRNQQVLSNTLEGLGMRMVWCEEPPYQVEFVKHLSSIRQVLQQGQASPEFYDTQLPVLKKLCEDMRKSNPAETQEISVLLNDFMTEPSTPKLIKVVEETERVALELCEIDQTKSTVMRAAWDGLIRNPLSRNLSPMMQNVLKARTTKDYSPEYYQKELQNNKFWQICKQVPQYNALESGLVKQMKLMAIPLQEVTNLKYDDIAFLINQQETSKIKVVSGVIGVGVPSDRAQYLKNLVAKHEKELRRSMLAFYKKQHTLSATLQGRAQHLSKQEINQSIMQKAQKSTDDAINGMYQGKSGKDFNAHHIFPLSNIAYYERMSGKSFTQINQDIVYINKDVHELLHMNENAMDNRGRLHLGKDMACRTKYVHQARKIQQGDKVIGYYGSAVIGIIMPKDGIEAMVDVNSYILDRDSLSENIRVQAQKTEYRQAKDAYLLHQVQDRVTTQLAEIPMAQADENEKAIVNMLKERLEKVATVHEYCDFADKFYNFQKILKKKLHDSMQAPNMTQQAILNIDTRYVQQPVTIPHMPTMQISTFLTNAMIDLKQTAQKVAMGVSQTVQKIAATVHLEMDKARQMIQGKNEKAPSNSAQKTQKLRRISKPNQIQRKHRQYA